MTYKDRRILIVMLTLMVMACAAPGGASSPEPITEPAIATPTQLVIPPTPTAIAIAAALPQDWIEERVDGLALSLARPPDWAVTPEVSGVTVAEANGEGWMQITLITSGTGNSFGLSYTTGMQGDAILTALLAAAQEDGAFNSPEQIGTRGENAALLAEGRNDPHTEQQIIGVISLPSRALVFIGHGGENADDWPRLNEIYRGVIASISAS